MNTKLQEKMNEQGISLDTLAKRIGRAKSTLSRMINGDSEFTRSDINLIRSALALTDDETMSIFFSKQISGAPAPRSWLKAARESADMTPAAMAAALNISEGYYRQIEAGERQQPLDMQLVSAISHALGKTVPEILSNEQESAAKEYWYFTFPCGAHYGKRAGKAVKVPGSYESARERMTKLYGLAWCKQMNQEEFNQFPGIELYDEGIIFEKV